MNMPPNATPELPVLITAPLTGVAATLLNVQELIEFEPLLFRRAIQASTKRFGAALPIDTGRL
jgi:hypothetical protein